MLPWLEAGRNATNRGAHTLPKPEMVTKDQVADKIASLEQAEEERIAWFVRNATSDAFANPSVDGFADFALCDSIR